MRFRLNKDLTGICIVTGTSLLVAGLLLVMPRVTPAADEGRTAPKAAWEIRLGDHVKKVQAFIEEQQELAKKSNRQFSSVSDALLTRKLTLVSDPMIVSQGWSGSAAPGGTISYTVGIYNPDSQKRSSLYVYVFVGPANAVPEVGAALATADNRFPRLTMPPFVGLELDPGATKTLTFSLTVPNGIEKSNYIGNTFLSQVNYHDVGKYLDRGAFPFEVK